MARVSILMNGYNSEKYLREAIDSVYSQTYQDWEIIFIDNCSSDNTAKIVKSYDHKIKYYQTDKNIPLGAARNFGLQYCTREYIAFLDTDDIWLKDKLMTQVELMDTNDKYQLSYGGVIYIDKLGKIIGSLRPKARSGEVFSQQLKRYEVNMQSVMLRNNDKIRFDTTLRHSPDFDLFMHIISHSQVNVIKEFLVKYRKLENSLTSKNIDVWGQEMKKTLDEIFMNNSDLINKYSLGYKMAYAKVAYYNAQYLISLGNKDKARKELSSVKYLSPRYMVLYLVSYFPRFLWNFIHKLKEKINV